MNVETAMLAMNLIVPLIMIVCGVLMYKRPPKNINGFIGYRTAMSRKNEDTWAYAHDYCGRLWIKAGIPLMVFSVGIQLPFYINGNNDAFESLTIVLETIQVAIIMISVIPVERALKRTFDENGKRR